MFHGQQMQQLPVPADALVNPFIQINPNQPPYTPQLPLPQQMMQFLPMISALVANEVQARAQDNPMRVFMFNLVSQNTFYNNEFAELVSAVCDYIMLMLLKRQFVDVPTAAQQCVPRVVEMVVAANVNTYPALGQYVPQQARTAVQGLINAFAAAGNEIMQMKQMQANQFNGGAAPGHHMQSYAHQGNGQMFVHQQQQQQVGITGNGQTASLFASNSQAVQPGFRQPNARADRWSQNNKPAIEEVSFEQEKPMQLQQPFNSRNVATELVQAAEKPLARKLDGVPAHLRDCPLLELKQDGSYLIPASESEADWMTNPVQPYIPAYNPTTHMMFHQVFPDGSVVIVVKELNQAMMDWNKHNLGGTSFGPRAKVEKMGSRDMDKVWDDVKSLNHANLVDTSAGVPDAEGEVSEVITPVQLDTKWKLGTSIESLLVEVRIAWLEAVAAKGAPILAFESCGTQYTVSVDNVDNNSVIERLSGVETYLGLAEKLKALKGDIGDSLWYAIDEVMTVTVNRVLRHNLSLPITMDRFSDDIADLLALIERKGQLVMQAFLQHQEAVIRTALAPIQPEHRQVLDESLLVGQEDYLKITYIGQDVSFTVLDCMSHDLEIELQDGVAAAVLESMTPDVYHLVRGIFDRADESGGEFARHLILTNDLKVLEATLGHIGKDFYMLTVMK